jgi:hypothetical protein
MSNIINTLLSVFSDNIGTILALLGVVIGAALSFISTWILRQREFKLRLLEKIIERRIQAHEQMARLAGSLSQRHIYGYYERGEDVDAQRVRVPDLMMSVKSFLNWREGFSEAYRQCKFYLAPDIRREVRLLYDYLFELDKVLVKGNPENIWAVGLALCDDFTDFASRIEGLAVSFLTRSVQKERFKAQPGYAYSLSETKRRLTGTTLMSNRQEIEALARSDPKDLEKSRWFSKIDYQD